MHVYAFILGRKYLLSVAELCNVIGDSGKIIDIRTEALVAVFDEPLKDPQSCLDRLGGTIKIVKIFNEDVTDNAELAPAIASYLAKKFEGLSGKLNYGVSLYSFTEKHEQILRKTLNQLKKELTGAGLKSRFINKNFKNPENAAIKGEKLLQKGAEIVAVQGTRKIFAGETVALQDFEAYGKRDFSRPERDPRLGMLPPKVAQMMINFSGKTNLTESARADQYLYDPFVGIGTIPMEGLLMGFSVIGSDIDGTILKKAQKNIEWIRNQTFNPQQKIRFFQKDATTLTRKDLPEEISLVVTESYLGPPVSKLPTVENMSKTFSHIREMTFRFFKALHPLLDPGTPVVISFPVYRDKNRFHARSAYPEAVREANYHFIENLVGKIVDSGFEIAPLIPREIRSKFSLPVHTREGLIYDRPDQIVGREIWKFIRR